MASPRPTHPPLTLSYTRPHTRTHARPRTHLCSPPLASPARLAVEEGSAHPPTRTSHALPSTHTPTRTHTHPHTCAGWRWGRAAHTHPHTHTLCGTRNHTHPHAPAQPAAGQARQVDGGGGVVQAAVGRLAQGGALGGLAVQAVPAAGQLGVLLVLRLKGGRLLRGILGMSYLERHRSTGAIFGRSGKAPSV